MDERVETESEQRHQTDTENHGTQLYVTPVDHIEYCTYVDVCMKGQRYDLASLCGKKIEKCTILVTYNA